MTRGNSRVRAWVGVRVRFRGGVRIRVGVRVGVRVRIGNNVRASVSVSGSVSRATGVDRKLQVASSFKRVALLSSLLHLRLALVDPSIQLLLRFAQLSCQH